MKKSKRLTADWTEKSKRPDADLIKKRKRLIVEMTKKVKSNFKNISSLLYNIYYCAIIKLWR